MKTAVLAVLLTVMQASPPVPRQAPDNQAGKGNKHSAKAKANKDAPTPTAAPVAVPGDAPRNAPQSERKSNPAPPSNTDETIRVSELPAVTVQTDPWTKGYVILTGFLVIFAGLGVCAALRTLGAIKRQADLMEGGLYVDTPRVIDLEDGKQPIFFVNIVNSGMIAARNVSYRIQIELGN